MYNENDYDENGLLKARVHLYDRWSMVKDNEVADRMLSDIWDTGFEKPTDAMKAINDRVNFWCNWAESVLGFMKPIDLIRIEKQDIFFRPETDI